MANLNGASARDVPRRARRLPKQPGPAVWNALLPPATPRRMLGEDIVADVAIIGAGFAGLSAARQLLQMDATLKVVVVDAMGIAEGPAGRNSGFMIDLPHDLSSQSYAGETEHKDQIETRLNRLAIDFARQFAEQYELPKAIFDLCGKMNAAASTRGDHHNLEYGRHLKRMGEAYQWLDAREMKAITGIDYYLSGLYTPGTAMIQPAAYIRALADSLDGAVSIYERSPVVEIKAVSHTSWRLNTPKGSVIAPKVILANNGHAESFGFFKRRLMHVFTYGAMTDAFDASRLPGEAVWSATPSDPMGTTVRRINDNGKSRLLVRTRFTYNPTMEVKDSAMSAVGNVLDKKFKERFPMLTDLNMAYRWGGQLCLSANGVPAHGEVDKGIIAAVCQNGLGVTKGTLAGLSAAQITLGMESEITEVMTNATPPKVLPPEPMAWLGANSIMRWKEWRAGRE